MTGPASTTAPTRRRSFASSGLSYEQVARELGVPWCDGLQCLAPAGETEGSHRASHLRGCVTIYPWEERRVHWAARPMTRRGLRTFLKLAVLLLYPETLRNEAWVNLYQQNILAGRLALIRFGVRIPRTYSERDRARVRLWLTQLGPFDTEFPEQRAIIRRVKSWARQ